MLRLLIPLLAFLLMTTSAIATADFTLAISMPESFLAGQTGRIQLTISNTGPTDWFAISIIGLPAWTYVEPWRVQIPAGSAVNVSIYISPPLAAEPATYSYILAVIRELDKSKIEEQLFVTIKSTVDAMLDLRLSCSICTANTELTATIRNIGTAPLTAALTVRLGAMARNYSIENLAAGENKSIIDSFDLSGLKPDNYSLNATLIADFGRTLARAAASFVIPTIEEIVYDKRVSGSIFATTVTLIAHNRGNAAGIASLESPVTMAWWALYSGPAPTEIAGGQYIWTTTLAPGESRELTYSEIYWPVPLLIIIIIICGLVAYFRLTPVTIRKAVLGRKFVSVGRDITVSINIRTARCELDAAVVRDTVPPIFTISQLAATKPILRKISTGTELTWRLGRLRAGEERILHYKIRPAAEVYGSMALGPASIRGRVGTKTIIKESNAVLLEGIAETGAKRIRVEIERS